MSKCGKNKMFLVSTVLYISYRHTSGASDLSTPLKYAICNPDCVFKIPFLPSKKNNGRALGRTVQYVI